MFDKNDLGHNIVEIEIFQEAESSYQSGLSLVRTGKFQEAEPFFRKAVTLQPENHKYIFSLGYCLGAQNKFQEAEPFFRKAITLQSENHKYNFFLGTCLTKQSKFQEAEPFLRRAVTLQPDNHDYNFFLGRCLTIQNKSQKAGPLFRHLTTQSKFQEAEPFFRKAITLQPENHKYNFCLGSCLATQNKFQEAKPFFRKAIMLQSENHEYNFCLGTYLTKQNKLQEAEPFFRKAIMLQPENHGYNFCLGTCLTKQNKLQEAEPFFRKAVMLQQDNHVYNFNLGLCFLEQKKLQEAQILVRKAIMLQPLKINVFERYVHYKNYFPTLSTIQKELKTPLDEDYLSELIIKSTLRTTSISQAKKLLESNEMLYSNCVNEIDKARAEFLFTMGKKYFLSLDKEQNQKTSYIKQLTTLRKQVNNLFPFIETTLEENPLMKEAPLLSLANDELKANVYSFLIQHGVSAGSIYKNEKALENFKKHAKLYSAPSLISLCLKAIIDWDGALKGLGDFCMDNIHLWSRRVKEELKFSSIQPIPEDQEVSSFKRLKTDISTLAI